MRSQSLSLKSQSSPMLTVGEIIFTASCVGRNTDILIPYFALYGEKYGSGSFLFNSVLNLNTGVVTQWLLGEKKPLKLHFLSVVYNLRAMVNKQIE